MASSKIERDPLGSRRPLAIVCARSFPVYPLPLVAHHSLSFYCSLMPLSLSLSLSLIVLSLALVMSEPLWRLEVS